jgi:hypothetical protein
MLIIVSLTFSCNSKKNEAPADGKGGQDHENVEIPDTAFKSLDDIVFNFPTEKRPVFLFFDAQAAGTQFINRYGKIFKKLDVGVIASNKYRNGIPAGEAGTILQHMIAKVQSHNEDLENVFLMGFSGGGKFAQNLADILPNVNGVITFGVGKRHGVQSKGPEINVLGINDLNLADALHDPLHGNYPDRDLILIHDGGHEWPSKQVMDYVVSICLKKSDRSTIKIPHFEDQRVNKLNKVLVKSHLTQNKSFAQQLGQMIGEEIHAEMSWKRTHQDIFQVNDSEIWRKLLTELDQEFKDSHTNARIRGYLSMINYILSNRYIESGDFITAQKQLDIYEMVDPGNPDIGILKALNLARQNKIEKALNEIKTVVNQEGVGFQKLLYTNFPDELTKRKDFVLTLNRIYPEREIINK